MAKKRGKDDDPDPKKKDPDPNTKDPPPKKKRGGPTRIRMTPSRVAPLPKPGTRRGDYMPHNLMTKSGQAYANQKIPKPYPMTTKRRGMSESAKLKAAKLRTEAKKKEREEAKQQALQGSSVAKRNSDSGDDTTEEEDDKSDDEGKSKIPLKHFKDYKKYEDLDEKNKSKDDAKPAAPKNPTSSDIKKTKKSAAKNQPPQKAIVKSLAVPKKRKVPTNDEGENDATQQASNKTQKISLLDPFGKGKKTNVEKKEGESLGNDDDVVLSTPQPLQEVRIGDVGQLDTKESKESCSSTMSYAKVKSTTPSTETGGQLIEELRNAFSVNVEELEDLAKEVLPDINSLPPKAIFFLLAIFGCGSLLPVTHMVANLADFVSIGTSMKFASIAQHKMRKDKHYQFRLRYFGGVGDQGSENLTDRNNPSLEVADVIRKFFTSIFNHPEAENIDLCVRRARSLFITAKTLLKPRGRGQNLDLDREGEQPSKVESSGGLIDCEEEIIACINFALLDGHGFFVNWLGTTNEPVTPKKYGDDLKVLCGPLGNFQHRHFALFLMKAVNFAVMTHLRLKNALSSDYIIVLQARVARNESGPHFYTNIGFEEVGPVENESTLEKETYPGFPKMLEDSKSSATDLMHFIWHADDICVFRNTTGTFGRIQSFSKRFKISYDEIDFSAQSDEFKFPFHIARRNIMLLACNLDFFFLPFDGTIQKEEEYIEPNSSYTDGLTTTITKRERLLIKKKGMWLNDECIDFYIRWQVTLLLLLHFAIYVLS